MNPIPAANQSYYAARAGAVATRPALSGTLKCDAAVVGGGLLGASAALHLAEAGLDVVLLEASAVGAGASGRSGGQLLPGLARGLDDVRRAAGPETAAELYRMTLDGASLVRRLIETHAIACDYRAGAMSAAARRHHLEPLHREADALTRLGHGGLRCLDGQETAQMLGTPRYFGALLDPMGAQADPLALTRGLVAAAERIGARVFEMSPARELELRSAPRRVRIALEAGAIEADHVILACNTAIGDLVPHLAAHTIPATTFMIATDTIDETVFSTCLPADVCVADTNFILDYFRRAGDRRLIWGGGVSYRMSDRDALSRRLISHVRAAYPQLSEIGVAYAWSGVIDLTMNRLPDVGRLDRRVLFAQGFSGHGLILAVLLGWMFGEAVSNRPSRLDLFADVSHLPFPGGTLMRRPLLVLAMLYARLMDVLG